MNIFALHDDPEIAGISHCSQHCNKMMLEYLQCIAHYFTLEQLKKAPLTQNGTHWKHFNPKHPSVLWLGESLENVEWLIELTNVLEAERLYRNYNPHFSTPFFNWVKANYRFMLDIPRKGLTSFGIAINDDSVCRQAVPNFEQLSPIEKYREFYIHDKTFATYIKRVPPDWLPTFQVGDKYYHLKYDKKIK